MGTITDGTTSFPSLAHIMTTKPKVASVSPDPAQVAGHTEGQASKSKIASASPDPAAVKSKVATIYSDLEAVTIETEREGLKTKIATVFADIAVIPNHEVSIKKKLEALRNLS